MSRGGADEGGILVLVEVILVAVIVLAVGLPLMMGARDDPGVTDTDSEWRRLAESSHNILEGLDALAPANLTTRDIDPEMGKSLLDRLVREFFLDGPSADWQWASIERGMVKDASVRAQLGYRVQHRNVTILGDEHGEPAGEAVVASRVVEPVWNGVYAWPRHTPVDGVSVLDFDAAFVNDSRIVRQEGEALRFVVRVGGGTATGSNVLYPAAQTTSYGLIGQSPDTGVPMANLKWRKFANRDYGGEGAGSIDAPGVSEQWNTALPYTVEVTAVGAAIPAGTLLHLRAEKGFETGGLVVEPTDDWASQSVATLPDGSVELVARRTEPIPSGTSVVATFKMNAFPACDPCFPVAVVKATTLPPPFSRLHAWLSDGAMGRTTAIIRHEATTTRDASTPLAVFPALPYAVQHDPLGGVSRARLGAVVQNGASATFIHTFRVEVPGGYDLRRFDGLGPPIFDTASAITSPFVAWRCFEAVTVCDPAGVPPAAKSGGASPAGTWSFAGERAVQWTGGRLELPPYSIATFLVDVPVKYAGDTATANGVTLQGTAFAAGQPGYFGSDVRFDANGHAALPTDGPGAWRAAPGVARHAAGPATATAPNGGYPTAAAGGGQVGPNFLKARLTWDRPMMVGPRGADAQYEYGAGLPSMQGLAANAANATLEPAVRTLRPGETAVFVANYEGVVRYLQTLGPAVQDILLTTELYGPASLPGRPVVRAVRDVTGVLNSGPRDVASGDLAVPLEADHEFAVGLDDGNVYVVTADAGVAAPVQPYAWKGTVTESGGDGGILRVVADDISPLSAGREVLVAAADGTVALFRASDGAQLWRTHVGYSLVAAEWTAAFGRIAIVVADPAGALLNAMTVAPANGAVESMASLPNVRPSFVTKLVPFTRPGGEPAMAVLDAKGAVTAFDAAGAAIMSYGRPPPTPHYSLLFAAASGDFDAAAPGDEIWAAYASYLVMYRADGTPAGAYMPLSLTGAGVTAAHSGYSVTGGAAPEMVVTLTDGTLQMLRAEQPGAPAIVWEVSSLDQAGTPPCADALEAAFPNVCDHLVFSPGHPIAVTMLRDPSAFGAQDVIAYGSKAVNGDVHMFVRRASDGGLVWSSSGLPAMPILFAPIGRDAGLPPAIAAAANDGAVFLRAWSTGANFWTQRVAPGGAAGTFTSYVKLPDAVLPGSYVVRTNLSWQREVTPGQVVRQEANLVNYVDVTWPDGTPFHGDFLLPLDLKAWRREWR